MIETQRKNWNWREERKLSSQQQAPSCQESSKITGERDTLYIHMGREEGGREREPERESEREREE